MEFSNDLIVIAIADTLVGARKRTGMTQVDLADRANASVRLISLPQTGRRQTSLSALAAVSVGLGMSMTAMIASAERRYLSLASAEPGPDNSTS